MSLRTLLTAVVLAGIAVAFLSKPHNASCVEFVNHLEAGSTDDQFDSTGAQPTRQR